MIKTNSRVAYSKNTTKKTIFIGFFLVFACVYTILSLNKSNADALMMSGEQLATAQQAGSSSHKTEHVLSPAIKTLQQSNIDKVLVDKSEQKLHLMENDVIIKSYHIALGDNPRGHKQQQGDERTPEGSYVLDYKNEQSIAYRSIHISYPNEVDKAYAQSKGVDVGGDIMIHGQMNGYADLADINQLRNWTDGCLAVTNDEMDEIMAAVSVGTPIEITW